MKTQGKQYKWKIVAWNALRRNEKKWTLQESQWFNRKRECIANVKEKMKNGYDSLESEEYLLKRRVMPRNILSTLQMLKIQRGQISIKNLNLMTMCKLF